MRYDGVIFDFDGTLADTSEGVLSSVEYALEKLGKPIPSRDVLIGFIGPALYDSFMKITNLDEETAVKAIALYREVYIPTNVYKLTVYEGIKELLSQLKEAGVKLSVASGKPQIQLQRAVEGGGLTEYFEKVVGPDPSVKTNDKEYLFKRARVTVNSVIVGDAIFDIEGAHKIGLPAIAVTYGFGNKDDLFSANPEFVAHTVREIKKFILE